MMNAKQFEVVVVVIEVVVFVNVLVLVEVEVVLVVFVTVVLLVEVEEVVVVVVLHMQGRLYTQVVVVDVVVVLVAGSQDKPHGCFSIDATVSMHVPSKLTREILSVQLSAKYNFFPSLSNAKPVGERRPALVLFSNTSVVPVVIL
jgi:hypothetical protein